MTKKFTNTMVVFLALTLIISNLGSITYSFAQTNKVNQVITTDCKSDKVTNVQLAKKTSTCIKLQWSSVKCATGYRIYRSTMKNGIYRRIDEVCDKNTCYVDKDLNCGTNYYYKIRACKKIGDKICLGCPSDILDTTTCPAVVKFLNANCVSNYSIELDWQTVYRSF